MIRRGSLLGGLGALVASAAWAESPGSLLNQDVLLAQAERVESHAEALSRLWPGYWPENQPFILYAPDIGAVFGGTRLPDTPRFRPGLLEGAEFHFVTDYPSGVADTILLRPDSPDDDLATLFHEQFHDFQSAAFRWMSADGHQEFVDLDAIPDLVGFIAALDLERLVLQAALLESDASTRRQLTQTYLALRSSRSTDLPAEVLTVQRQKEWSEGTAEFIGLKASKLIAGCPDAALPRTIAGNLAVFDEEDTNLVSGLFRWRAYPVGAALTWLLEDINPDEWRTHVSRGVPLDVLLRQTIGDGSAEDIAAAEARFDLASLKLQAADRLGRTSESITSRDAFLDRAPHWLVLELEFPADRGKDVKLSFSGTSMIPLPNDGIAIPDGAVVIEAPGVTLKSGKAPVLIEAPADVVEDNVTGHLIYLPVAADSLLTLSPGRPAALDLDGLSLRISMPFDIQHGADRTRITIRLPNPP